VPPGYELTAASALHCPFETHNQTSPTADISITSHARALSSLLEVLQQEPYYFQPGEVRAVVVKGTREPVKEDIPRRDFTQEGMRVSGDISGL
jgi:hypothetical protein